MNLKKRVLLKTDCLLSVLVLVVQFLAYSLLIGCSDGDSNGSKHKVLTVYKTPSCGCCAEWVSHMRQNGFQIDVVNQDSVAHIKDYYNIPAQGRSCHTAVSDAGLVFEGHVPAKWVKYYIENSGSEAKGLVVPAMPLGSPGMEYQDQFNPYVVFALSETGVLESFVEINSYNEQF